MAETKVVSVGASSTKLETATKDAVAKLEDALAEIRADLPESKVTSIDHQWNFVPHETTEELPEAGFMVTMVAVLEH